MWLVSLSPGHHSGAISHVSFFYPAFGKTRDMPLDLFCAHVNKMHLDNNRGFSEEYRVSIFMFSS